MNDLISRQAAIDTVAKHFRIDNDLLEVIVYEMERLPSAQLDTQWIPCSPETMPKKTDYYLVQYTRKYCRNEMAVAFYSVEEARCDDDYTWEIETFSDIKEVIAWMPLPKPYREEGERK